MNATTNGAANGATTRSTSPIPGPLTTAADMPSRWDDVEVGFDEAAERIIQAHAKDGAPQDLPIGDLQTWAVAPLNGELALVPLARHHEPKPMRSTAFSNLMTRVGAPADFIRKLPAPLARDVPGHVRSAGVASCASVARRRYCRNCDHNLDGAGLHRGACAVLLLRAEASCGRRRSSPSWRPVICVRRHVDPELRRTA
jgi:hypothetical protein